MVPAGFRRRLVVNTDEVAHAKIVFKNDAFAFVNLGGVIVQIQQ
jgi:hypothetical protein